MRQASLYYITLELWFAGYQKSVTQYALPHQTSHRFQDFSGLPNYADVNWQLAQFDGNLRHQHFPLDIPNEG